MASGLTSACSKRRGAFQKDVSRLHRASCIVTYASRIAYWAHELIALGDERALLSRFGRVLINGQLLK